MYFLKKRFFRLGLLFIWIIIPASAITAEARHVYGPRVDTHLIKSKYVDQTFEIHVMDPSTFENGEKIDNIPEELPVLYVMDADSTFGAFSIIAGTAIYDRVVPPFILVGVGYPGDIEMSNWGTLRVRDFLDWSENRLQSHARDNKYDLKKRREEIPNWGRGAPNFLEFIRSELFTFVDNKYSTKPDDRAYFGFSGGGQFGLYTMTNKPDTFNRYIIGSPGVEKVEDVVEFFRAGTPLKAKVFLGVGGDEDFANDRRYTGQSIAHFKLTQAFREGIPKGLEFSRNIFPNETHNTAWNPIFSHGIRAIYNPNNCKPYLFPEGCPEK